MTMLSRFRRKAHYRVTPAPVATEPGIAAPPPRIAIILPRLTVNGVQKVNLQLAAQFHRSGLDVDIVTREPAGPMAACIPADIGVYAVGVQSRLLFFTDLLRYLRQRNPTHVISPNDDVSLMVLVARRLLFVSPFCVFVSHNSIIGSHRAHSRGRVIRNAISNWFLHHWYKRAEAIVAVSQGLATELVDSFGVSKDQISVIHNPIISSEFAALRDATATGRAPFAATDCVIGFFGRLEPQKNVRLLIEAFARSKGTPHCHLLIVGEGRQRKELGEQAEALGVSSRVTFRPFVANPLPNMRRCSLIVLPSIYEGFPTVLVEAMACGTQVVATDCDYGPREVLEGGQLGQLVPINDAAALAAAIERSVSKRFFIPPERLVAAGMRYTAQKSAEAYLRVMRIQQKRSE